MRLFADVGGADDEVGPVILAGELAPQPIGRATDSTHAPGVGKRRKPTSDKNRTCKFRVMWGKDTHGTQALAEFSAGGKLGP